MSEDRRLSRLYAGDRLLGVCRLEDLDFPRVYATFSPVDEFESVREFFERQSESPDDMEVLERINELDLRLISATGREMRLMTIFTDGERAMWRSGFSRSIRMSAHNECWSQLGEEEGPQQCVASWCKRLSITDSARCKRHRFQEIMGEDYAGIVDD